MASNAPPLTGDLTREYFGAMPLDKIVPALQEVERNWRDVLKQRGLPNLWRIIYAQVFGMDPHTRAGASQQLQYVGPEADYCRFRVNITRSHVKQRLMMAQGQRPSFGALAANNDAESLAQVPVAAKIIDYIARETQLERVAYRALESDGYFGEGGVWTRWDADLGEMVSADVPQKDPQTGQPMTWPDDGSPVTTPGKLPSGAPVLTNLYPWQIVKEMMLEKPPWAIIKEPISRYELAANFPEKAKDILSLPALGKGTQDSLFAWAYGTCTSDVIELNHFYHKGCRAVPGGRYVGYAGDIPLWDAPCPLGKSIPLVLICSGRYFGTSFGYPEAADLLSMQEMIDELLSQSATNAVKFGNQSLWAEDGVEFDQKTLAEGGRFFTLKAGQEPPKAIQWAEMPDITKFLLEYLPERMNEISGLNSTVRGSPDSNITSGVFAALMLNIAEKYQGATQAEYDFALNELGNQLLEFVRANAVNGFAAEVAGIGELPYVQVFKAEDLQGIHRVQIVRQNPLMNSFPGRMEVLNATKDLMPPVRQAAVEMLLSGNPDPYVQKDQSCAILIRRENERLMRGMQCEVKISDNPQLHCPEHRGSLDKLRAQDPPQDPMEFQQWQAAISAHMQHLADHAQTWANTDPTIAAMLGLPMPPPPPMPPGMPAPVPANNNAASSKQPSGVPGKAANGANLPAPPGAEPKNLPRLPSPAQPPKEANLANLSPNTGPAV